MEGNLLNVNDSWERLLGYSSDYLQNQNFLDFVHPEDLSSTKEGDRLIKTIADIMKRTCRSDDIIGRMGGDEFLILLPNTDYAQATKIKKRMMSEASNAQSNPFSVSFAIGYGVKTMVSQKIVEIEKTADRNMYRHKAKYGKLMRNKTVEAVLSYVFYKDDAERIHAERVSLSSYNILKGADEYAGIAQAILYHHERPDGKGYPKGLEENKIPLLSKIIAVAEAIKELKKHSGIQFDAEIVDVFTNTIL